MKRGTLLLAPEIFSSEGGIPRILQTYLKALCELAGSAGRVRLLALNDTMMDSRDLRRCDPGNRIADWRVCGRRKSQFVRAALGMGRASDRIVCGHVAQLPVALAAKMLNPRLDYYLVAHGVEVWRGFSLAERLALSGVRRIFCVSDYTRRELLQHVPVPERKTSVLYNALDPSFEAVTEIAPPAQPPVILAITRLSAGERYKGIDHLIQAMPAIRAAHPEAVLRIIGRGDDLGRMQKLAARLDLGPAVAFLGYVEDARLRQQLRDCTLFALPSEKEGFGLVYLEAMACGRPCLGARSGGVPEVITPESGVLVNYGDVPAIAAECSRALDRQWDAAAVQARAAQFSYSQFRDRLGSLLSA